MPASPARRAAFDILLRVACEDAYAGDLLHSSLTEKLSDDDAALATELVMGTLRWQGALDSVLAAHVSGGLAKLDLGVLIALRLGACQLLLTRVPPHAAVHESVELARHMRKRSAAGLINAVLRKIATATLPDDAAVLSHPVWLVKRWRGEYGEAGARTISEDDQRAPQVALRLRDQRVEDGLRAGGVELAPGRLLTSARRVVHGNVTRTSASREGRVAIQDEASQLVALLVGRGRRILDCCAAPGGKTAILAERNPESEIVAAELHPHRARQLRERLAGTQVEVRSGDICVLAPSSTFNRVLADVPCSGTGTLARNPEIRWKLAPADLKDLQQRQQDILRAALRHLVPGGRAVYSTCSLEAEECERVVENVLAEIPSFRTLPCAEVLDRLRDEGELSWSDLAGLLRGPYLRTLPGVHPCEGFFAAIIERIA